MSCYIPDDDDVTYAMLQKISFVMIVMIVGF